MHIFLCITVNFARKLPVVFPAGFDRLHILHYIYCITLHKCVLLVYYCENAYERYLRK